MTQRKYARGHDEQLKKLLEEDPQFQEVKQVFLRFFGEKVDLENGIDAILKAYRVLSEDAPAVRRAINYAYGQYTKAFKHKTPTVYDTARFNIELMKGTDLHLQSKGYKNTPEYRARKKRDEMRAALAKATKL